MKGKIKEKQQIHRESVKKVIRVACSQQDEEKKVEKMKRHTRERVRERKGANVVFFPFNIMSKHYQQLVDNSNGGRSIPHTKNRFSRLHTRDEQTEIRVADSLVLCQATTIQHQKNY